MRALLVSGLALVSLTAFTLTGTASADLPMAGTLAEPDRTVELAAARPDWLTDDLLAEVAAADGPVAAPVEAIPDLPVSGFVGIRPGSWMVSPAGCTMNFVFTDGSGFAIGTAGHCVDGGGGNGGGNGGGKGGKPSDAGDRRGQGGDRGTEATSASGGEPIVLLTAAPGGTNPVLIEIGPVLVHRDNGIGDDFALIEIPSQYHDWVFPTIAQVGGPCGTYTGSGPETVAHYGHGVAIGTGGTPRAGLALNWREDAYGWDGVAIFGDSGSAVRVTDLQAAGNLTHLVVSSEWLPSFIAGTRMTRILELTGKWSLVDSPYCPLS